MRMPALRVLHRRLRHVEGRARRRGAPARTPTTAARAVVVRRRGRVHVPRVRRRVQPLGVDRLRLAGRDAVAHDAVDELARRRSTISRVCPPSGEPVGRRVREPPPRHEPHGRAVRRACARRREPHEADHRARAVGAVRAADERLLPVARRRARRCTRSAGSAGSPRRAAPAAAARRTSRSARCREPT